MNVRTKRSYDTSGGGSGASGVGTGSGVSGTIIHKLGKSSGAGSKEGTVMSGKSSSTVTNVNGGGGGGSSLDRASIFATENSTTVMAQVGGTATLPCVVRKFSSGVVSIIFYIQLLHFIPLCQSACLLLLYV